MAQTQLVRSPSCGAPNRVPLEKVRQGLAPVCGRHKTPLPAGAGPVTVTDATFAGEVERSPRPVLLDMWPPWFGPRRTVGPVIDQLASELAGLGGSPS